MASKHTIQHYKSQSIAANCTHMTVTRLYTTTHICSICSRPGASGWLYRCTQDRDLLIEADIEDRREEKLDEICDLIPKSNHPKKCSAAARKNPLSLLDEITDSQFRSYTPKQIGTLLQQRTRLQAILTKGSPEYSTTLLRKFNSSSPRPMPMPTADPWVPETECQYKVCATCRPSFKERSYLSLDMIANGDIPASAIVGFGFHLNRGRPVAKVDVVRELGLRENPPVMVQTRRKLKLKRKGRRERLGLNVDYNEGEVGLGIASDASDDETTTLLTHIKSAHVKNEDATTSDETEERRQTQAIDTNPSSLPSNPSSVFSEHENESSHTPLAALNSFTTTPHQLKAKSPTSSHLHADNDVYTTENKTPKQPKIIITKPEDNPIENKPTENRTEHTILTAMEVSEAQNHIFYSEALDVRDGIAVMEESVELHIPDLITHI